ncbi:high mobility group B protein 7 [Malania oleifera]|uniref:high mobility group B protein 7 n=1 Tax=Malania oleifera TaxID=397392 RepID=UPI0025AE556E|nr:high mobility group B protein 7 [Malania oleifera]
MANRPRFRNRVVAIRRAPDGSAFENCNNCGASVPISLADMHQCEPREDLKKGVDEGHGGFHQNLKKQSLDDKPRSAFCFFMESFVQAYESENPIETNQKGFERWKNMSKEERQVYVLQAEKVNSAYLEAMLKEVDDNPSEVDDEADSAAVGKFDPFYEGQNSDSFESFWSESFYTYD